MIFEFLILFFAIFTDLYSKNILFTKVFVDGISQKSFIPNFITFEKAYNKGAAFGSFSNSLFFIKILPIFITIILIGIYIYFKIVHLKQIKKDGFLTPKYKIFSTSAISISMMLLIGGSIGNLYDRFFIKDGVRDFLRYDFIEAIMNRNFAIGNIADLYIIFGVVFLFIYLIKMLFLTEKKDDTKKYNK